jgi:hypothetical protein
MTYTSHDCDKQKHVDGVVIYSRGRWVIIVETHGDAEPINFCPYCGVKLEEPEHE